jgi:manganese/zinc/iron transport system permease protein
MISHTVLIVSAGVSILGACSGMVGCYATLRRRALTGDALAHAALPGLCVAFLVTEQRSLPVLLVGALLSGLLGVAVISFLRRWTRIKEDAAIGIVLSVFFGAGIVLLRLIQNRANGGGRAGLDSFIFGKTAAITEQDVRLITAVSMVCLLAVMALYKEFKLISFDSDFARTQGWPVLLLDLFLMGLFAVVVVVGLPAVGVVMMAALLILPSVTARFWSDRLGVNLVLSAGFGFVTGLVGVWLSDLSPALPAGPIIVLVGAAFFVVSALLSPHRGLLGVVVRRSMTR